ncbi:hypothetical protein QWZ16_05560 [Vibrio ostreicida]|uniref:Uncharacterized protein n=1 Tax=Vibrio ostreicida TaxID=526588 RepID=A0ABT8BSU8_9VIBR|nr:hypothetical protein [Vibrio ostreicida]MDN3609190.1 hypothetical protein [Vibrio ostreicida]
MIGVGISFVLFIGQSDSYIRNRNRRLLYQRPNWYCAVTGIAIGADLLFASKSSGNQVRSLMTEQPLLGWADTFMNIDRR